MPGPITRTFLCTRDGALLFVEISWQGSDVEVVTGKVGTAGRGSPKVFEDITERDAFIAKRVHRALREGFVEGVPADVPAPESPDPAERRVTVLLKKHKTTAYLPRVDVDDARRASKFGGTPWLATADTWPACSGCSQPLRFVCQLALADVPEPARWAFRSDLLQLFLCDSTGKAGDPEWLCQAQGKGWEAFAPSTVVRHVSCAAGPGDIRDALPLLLLDLRRRCSLERMASYCRITGDEGHAKTWEARIGTEQVDPKSYDVPGSVEQFQLESSFLLPAKRVVEWSGEPDVPAYGDLDLDEVDALRERGLQCQSADKLGGYPNWAQSPRVPRCPGCRKEMRYLLQLVTNGAVPIGIGGDGLGWVFVCPTCREATFTWQR